MQNRSEPEVNPASVGTMRLVTSDGVSLWGSDLGRRDDLHTIAFPNSDATVSRPEVDPDCS